MKVVDLFKHNRKEFPSLTCIDSKNDILFECWFCIEGIIVSAKDVEVLQSDEHLITNFLELVYSNEMGSKVYQKLILTNANLSSYSDSSTYIYFMYNDPICSIITFNEIKKDFNLNTSYKGNLRHYSELLEFLDKDRDISLRPPQLGKIE